MTQQSQQQYANAAQEKARRATGIPGAPAASMTDFYNQTNAATAQHYADMARQKQERKANASAAPLDRSDRAPASISLADLVGGYITADDGQFLERVSVPAT